MKKKRRMPAHIVLPNGMWRFVKRGASRIVKRARRVRAKRKLGGFSMARRRYSRRSYGARRRGRSRGMFGLGRISIKGILFGAAAAYASQQFAPQVVPYQDTLAGAAVGKVMRTGLLSGAIGGTAYDLLTTGGSLSMPNKIGGNY